MKKPKLKKYPTGGTKTTPTVKDNKQFVDALSKYKKIDQTVGVPSYIANYVKDSLKPELSESNSYLDAALRKKYNLSPTDVIDGKMLLTKQEGMKVLGNDKYNTYVDKRNAYSAYRDKTSWESRTPEKKVFTPQIGQAEDLTPAYDSVSSTMFNTPYVTNLKKKAYGGVQKFYDGGEVVASAADQEQIDKSKPNYGVVAGVTTGALANSMITHNNPDANTSMKAEANRNGVAAIAGSINPVVGGIIGGANAIGKGVQNNVNRTNSKGVVVNRNDAQAGAIIGGLASPSSAFAAMADGNWDLKGKKYVNSLEADAQARIAEERAPMLAAEEAKRNMYYTYAQGGVHSGMPTAEVEKQEVMRMPDGSTPQVDGASHENGGIPVNIPDGTQIFSDRLKDPTTKKTFAKMAEKYKVNKEQKIIDNPKADKTAKSTAQLIADIKHKKLDALFQTQEALKQAKLNKYAEKLGLSNEFRNGGTKLPKFDGGGTWVDGRWIPNSTTKYGYSTPEGTFTADGTKTADSYGQPVGFDSPLPMITNQDLENRNNMEIRAVQDASIPKVQQVPTSTNNSNNRRIGTDWIEPATNTLLQNSGNIMDLAMSRMGKKYDKEDYGQVTPNLYDPREALRQADIEARVTRGRLKDASGGNAGALMSNLQQSQAVNTINKSKIRTEASNLNNQVLNDFAWRNKELNLREISDTKQNKARSEDIARQAVRGVGTNTSAAYRDYKAGKMDQNTAKMISSMFTNYKLDMNNPQHFEWVFKTVNQGK